MDSRIKTEFKWAELDYPKAYFIFVLGYDILNDWLNSFDDMPCDVAFSICEMAYCNFRCSEYYKDMSMSEYEALQKYVCETSINEIIKGAESLLKESESEFAVEVCKIVTDTFCYQVDIFTTIDEAKSYIENHNLDLNMDEYYRIVRIDYDGNETEIGTEIVY